jgi:hypothetical protein
MAVGTGRVSGIDITVGIVVYAVAALKSADAGFVIIGSIYTARVVEIGPTVGVIVDAITAGGTRSAVIVVTSGAVVVIAHCAVVVVTGGAVVVVTDAAVIIITDGRVIVVTNGRVIVVTNAAVIVVSDAAVIIVTDGRVVVVTNSVIIITDGRVIVVSGWLRRATKETKGEQQETGGPASDKHLKHRKLPTRFGHHEVASHKAGYTRDGWLRPYGLQHRRKERKPEGVEVPAQNTATKARPPPSWRSMGAGNSAAL